MPWTLAGSVAVVVAHQFNPTIMTQIWLRDNGILAAEDFQEGSLYSDMVVQVRSRLFHLLVLPDQLQFVPVGPPEGHHQLVVDRLGAIVRTLPHTPYRALGLNFTWHLTSNDGDIAGLTRRLFFDPNRALYRQFDVENAHFGGYLSKDVAGFRLRLDIKPILVPTVAGPENRLQFAFNFHRDLGEAAAGQIEEALQRWNEASGEVEQIIDSVEMRQP